MDSSVDKPIARGPRTRVCYVCGRQYGLTSYEIHLKQCKELWTAREALKDPKERKSLPIDPMLGILESSGRSVSEKVGSNGGSRESELSASELDEINKLASTTFNSVSLDTCKFCGRTFLPEKLLIHNRSCTSEKPARKVNDSVNRRGSNSASTDANPSMENDNNITKKLAATSQGSNRTLQMKKASSLKNMEIATSEFASDSTSNDNMPSSPILVGSMGGRSGRKLRTTTAGESKSVSFNLENASSDEAIAAIALRLNEIEITAMNLVSTVGEMKKLLAFLSNKSIEKSVGD